VPISVAKRHHGRYQLQARSPALSAAEDYIPDCHCEDLCVTGIENRDLIQRRGRGWRNNQTLQCTVRRSRTHVYRIPRQLHRWWQRCRSRNGRLNRCSSPSDARTVITNTMARPGVSTVVEITTAAYHEQRSYNTRKNRPVLQDPVVSPFAPPAQWRPRCPRWGS